MRINGFEQIKAFYSWVFNNQDKGVNTSHISLYNFLINQNNRNNWVEWFKVPYDLGMAGSCIGSRNTYYKCLDDLQEWGLIKYIKGVNNHKAPLVYIYQLTFEQLTEQASVPLSEQLIEPLHEPLGKPLYEPLPEHIYKLVTSNLELVTGNLARWIKEEEGKNKKPTWDEFLAYAKTLQPYRENLEFSLHAKYDTWVNAKWRDGFGREIKDWKGKLRNTILHLPKTTETLQKPEIKYNKG